MKRFIAAALLCSLAMLSACKTDQGLLKPYDSLNGKRAAREARLSTAAAAAIAANRVPEALARYERLHKDRPRDETVAVNYAQLLRKTGDADGARDVLKPFMFGPDGREKGDAAPTTKNEYAAVLIAEGDFRGAENILNSVLEDKKAAAVGHDAHNLMGVALDAQGQHKEAEQMFRLALDGWTGDPSSVMNNLGLCLAAEGMFDESLTTLRQALIMAPDKEEIARNIKVVTDLRDRVVKKPAPAAKKIVKAKKKKKS